VSGQGALSIRLLRAAEQITRGKKELAERLGIGEALLARFLTGFAPLPDPLLLRTVDIVLAHRPQTHGRE
jgi:transcriptional regulator with XRE-family HTH domain